MQKISELRTASLSSLVLADRVCNSFGRDRIAWLDFFRYITPGGENVFRKMKREVTGILKKRRRDTSAICRTEKGSPGVRHAED
jgi:hypothetical protein